MAHASVNGRLKLFALNSSRVFGEQVAQRLSIELSPHEERDFEDGEHKARPLISVRGQDVFVIQSLYADQKQSGNDKLCRLLFFIGALKDAAAARVTAVVPYLAYARKDRKTQARDPVMTRYVASLFEAMGTDSVVAMDVHNLAAFQNAFRCPTEHLDANNLFVHYFAPLLRDSAVVVVSPDAGGIKRAESFRRLLSTAMDKPVSIAFAEKHRSGGVVSGDMLMGEMQGRTAVIVDDMISSGTTLARAAHACHVAGATRVFAAATHGLFNRGAGAVLMDAGLERIVVTDTVSAEGPERSDFKSNLLILSCTGLIAQEIHRIHENDSNAELLESWPI